MNQHIEWGDPPSTPTRYGEVTRFVDALRSRPGEWAKYPHHMTNASSVANNRIRFSGTEWTSRKRTDGRFDIYGRVVA